jgi:type IV secretion system protein VirB1
VVRHRPHARGARLAMALIACKECGHLVSNRAASCRHCGSPVAGGRDPAARLPIAFAACLIAFMVLWCTNRIALWVMAAGGSPSAAQAAVPAPQVMRVPTPSPQPAGAPRLVYQTTAEQLYQDYDTNALRTQTKIGDRWIRVLGAVAGLDEDAAGHPLIKLFASDGNSARLTLSVDQQVAAANLTKGERVEIQCDRMQRSGGSPLGSGCLLVLIDATAVGATTIDAAAPALLQPPSNNPDAAPMMRVRRASAPMHRYRRNFPPLAARCGPAVDPTTTAAVVKTESDYDALVVRDNTLRVTFNPPDPVSAHALVDAEMRAGHQLAIGLMQVTTPWARRLRLRPADLLDPCTNIRVGTSILAADYRACSLPGRAQNQTLACALSMYWSGHPTAGGAYVNQVYRHAGSAEHVPETAGVSDGELGATASAQRP